MLYARICRPRTMRMMRTYTELIAIPDFLDRYRYLKIGGTVGSETFGNERWLNQRFYNSREWRNFRRSIIIRDFGCDLAHLEHPFESNARIIIHHMNPIVIEDIRDISPDLMNPEFVIAVSFSTHQAIHYGDESLLGLEEPVIRTAYDTCPWR